MEEKARGRRMGWRSDSLEYRIWLLGLLLGMAAVLAAWVVRAYPLLIRELRMPCWIRENAGVYCPGCGMTRALLALLHGRLLLAAWYHPAVFYAAIAYIVFMLRGIAALASRGRLPFMKWRLGYVYWGIAIILFQFLLKNILLLGFHLQWMP